MSDLAKSDSNVSVTPVTPKKSYKKQLDKLLRSVKTSGKFAVGKNHLFLRSLKDKGERIQSLIYPGLQINGVGKIGLPLIPSQIQEIIKQCEQAPYGKGEETIVDTSVRNTWQLSPTKFQITNPTYFGISK